MLKDKPVPLPIEKSVKVMEIGRALKDALLTGEVQRFDEKGVRIYIGWPMGALEPFRTGIKAVPIKWLKYEVLLEKVHENGIR